MTHISSPDKFTTQLKMISRQQYHGTHRKLVLAFDVGTTYSGISYSILDPGEVPEIKGVTRHDFVSPSSEPCSFSFRFPAQENVGGDSKIPSILYYDLDGELRAVGAEALQEHIVEEAEDNGWIKLEWWKLHLRPKHLVSSHVSDDDIPALPLNKSAVQVLGEFMKYLYRCAQTYIQDTHSREVWKSIENDIDFVLTHPNGWEGAQQSDIRRAAIIAGLIEDTVDGHSRLQLLTEGEASLHFCLGNGLTADFLKNGQGVIVVDAGGGTVDLSAYCMTVSPDSFEEIAPTECRLQGSVFISRRARAFLQEKLKRSIFGTSANIDNMVNVFDKSTKLKFRNPDDPSYIRFGGVKDRDLAVGIRSGQLKLPGSEVAVFFEPSIQCIIDAIEQQSQAAYKNISSVFLVGGFAASDWLFSRLQKYLSWSGINLCRPDSHVNKAVADGAVSFYLDHCVSVRVAKWTYGTSCRVRFNPLDEEHCSRIDTVYTDFSGLRFVPKAFSPILAKGTRVTEDIEFERSYFEDRIAVEYCDRITTDILCYRGESQDPAWRDIEPEMFSTLCHITADTSQMAKALRPLHGPGGTRYYRLSYRIVLLFGLTELKAQIDWMENGEQKRSPAKVVYDHDMTIACLN
ncbi:hypothetical protein PILCRDRAFT_4705 [Piloderma croceum F 1598]|uniref:Uncharacterized protein n=1 Tax=Piloderma croceum (strain F 1598) TaxID=765440 RepID=A0A0C3CAU9_PILCF|nr:hypothetical protein PILCRDRAFT_4705 [Piloderma croceum F 1598]